MSSVQSVGSTYTVNPQVSTQVSKKKSSSPILKGTLIGAGTGAVVGGSLGALWGKFCYNFIKKNGKDAIDGFEQAFGKAFNKRIIAIPAVKFALPVAAVGGLLGFLIGAIVKAFKKD